MQVNRPIWIFLGLLMVGVVLSHAQENDYSAKMIAEIKAKAETGNAEAQLELAKC
jgi:hypothetical protein